MKQVHISIGDGAVYGRNGEDNLTFKVLKT